ncbi:hypothetical protein TELCIR_20109 [Teladorsagia circumcincta]|uniref:Uncharacterized protein n=1 Tax=Teladorsagia circumcincta TaxID=45464 RepID=A0A2G9TKE7_TELCI|nr:hypothetical protein TELCIR_20109 [Teladorsagia circumcincta]
MGCFLLESVLDYDLTANNEGSDHPVPNCVSPVHLLCILISVQIVFLVTHWEKYNTGVLYLSWGYDASQYALTFVYLFTYIVGYEWFKFYVYSNITFADLFEASFYVCCLGSLIMSGYNMWYSYAVDHTFKQKSVYEAVRPVIPCVMLFAVSISWAVFSRTDVCGTDPRTFFFAMGTVFSNIAVSFEHFCSLQVDPSHSALKWLKTQ